MYAAQADRPSNEGSGFMRPLLGVYEIISRRIWDRVSLLLISDSPVFFRGRRGLAFGEELQRLDGAVIIAVADLDMIFSVHERDIIGREFTLGEIEDGRGKTVRQVLDFRHPRSAGAVAARAGTNGSADSSVFDIRRQDRGVSLRIAVDGEFGRAGELRVIRDGDLNIRDFARAGRRP
jgi:hypothetical protein